MSHANDVNLTGRQTCQRRSTTPQHHLQDVSRGQSQRPTTTGHRSSLTVAFDKPVTEHLTPRTEERNMFDIPSSLYPEYRSVPIPMKLLLGLASILINIKINRSIPIPITITIQDTVSALTRNTRSVKFILRAFATFLLSTLLAQDILYAPSRIDTPALLKNGWLPSPLSKYSTITATIPSSLIRHDITDHTDKPLKPIGVHFLEYTNDDRAESNYRFDAVHFNHGFGASSLSWLPALPSIVHRIGGRVGIAHDAPGFGFTDRPPTKGKRDGLLPYGSAGSAALGNALLSTRINGDDGHPLPGEAVNGHDGGEGGSLELRRRKKVALFGHSMGCAATLRMAIALPSDVEKVIVLVSPALVGKFPSGGEAADDGNFGDVEEGARVRNSEPVHSQSQPSKIILLSGTFIAFVRRLLVDPFLMYLLRRLVGQAKFWSKGLRLAWGDPNLLTEDDALRYKWPSIGLGWERGLLAFTRSRLTSTSRYDGRELDLLSEVIESPNTKVIIVHGSKDRVIPVRQSQKIAEVFEKVTFVEATGQGHDPFEENLKGFLEIIETRL